MNHGRRGHEKVRSRSGRGAHARHIVAWPVRGSIPRAASGPSEPGSILLPGGRPSPRSILWRHAVSITAEDIKRAQEILRRWRQRAQVAKNDAALKAVEHVMRVLSALYGGKTCLD